MNLAIDLPDDLEQAVRNLPDQRSFLLEAIKRELQRRTAVKRLLALSETVSRRNEHLSDAQLQELLLD